VVVGVGDDGARPSTGARMRVKLLGPVCVLRGEEAVRLPPSRKVRALLAYLALAPGDVSRSQLCELLFEMPDDPRGELRWCLSRLRGVIDDRERRRVVTHADRIRVDLSDCEVDAVEIARSVDAGIASLAKSRREKLEALFGGEFLEGLEIEHSPAFDAWLTAQRWRFRNARVALLEHLAAADGATLAHVERWLDLAPFDPNAHARLLAVLARTGRIREGDAHVATTVRRFEAEGLDPAPIRAAWRAARADSHTATVRGTPSQDQEPAAAPRRASLAVMPFVDPDATERGGAADALAHDVITRLAQLRCVFVIAQGTVFALHERRIGPEEAGRMLDVDYVVAGTVRRRKARVSVTVELIETRSARILWAEDFEGGDGGALRVLDEIGDRIVASVASEVEANERNRAVLRPPNSLDAWEAHHRGLWHMYRFNRDDNAQAHHFFTRAIALDPTFARAYAGLSFTHFQNAFQGWGAREAESEHALRAATQSLLIDERDPAAHWAMGRALWLGRRDDRSIEALERAVDLSPNFALGHYALAFVNAQTGDPRAAIASADASRRLSPFDPLLFGMLAARAMALVRLGRLDEAAEWAVKAARRPNAHPHIDAIAAICLALAGATDEAGVHAQATCRALPGYRSADFFRAFRFHPDDAARFREGAARVGMT
jgi:DNA-binding SARP family transcriptional activator